MFSIPSPNDTQPTQGRWYACEVINAQVEAARMKHFVQSGSDKCFMIVVQNIHHNEIRGAQQL